MTWGVKGFIYDANSRKEFQICLHAIEEGEIYVSNELHKSFKLDFKNPDSAESLTPSELKIILLISMNRTTPQIANQLFISTKTVEKHRSNISKKLMLSGKTNSLLLWAKENLVEHSHYQ